MADQIFSQKGVERRSRRRSHGRWNNNRRRDHLRHCACVVVKREAVRFKPCRERAHWSWNSSLRQANPQLGPESVVAYTSDPLDDAAVAAKKYLAKNLTWAIRFEISDHEGRLLYRWPEERHEKG